MSRICSRFLLPSAAIILFVFATDALAGPRGSGQRGGNVAARSQGARSASAIRSRTVVRDHRAQGGAKRVANPVIRDHRKLPVVRDHRANPIVRDHRKQPIVRDHRKQPVIRDHRTGPIKVPVKRPIVSRPLPPIDPGIGNGGHGERQDGHHGGHYEGHHTGHHGGHHVPHRPWHKWRPAHCWWWYDYCRPLQNCRPDAYVTCNWRVVQCGPVVIGDVATTATRWYLGLEGMVLPGKGLGIESVEEGSPAALAGLQPGMVIVRCNGIALVDEDSVSEAISSSGGALRLEILPAEGAEPVIVPVAMQRVSAVKF